VMMTWPATTKYQISVRRSRPVRAPYVMMSMVWPVISAVRVPASSGMECVAIVNPLHMARY
jgi:hypothetical protein